MQVILYNPKDPVFPPPHKLVVDALRPRKWDMLGALAARLDNEKTHAACRRGEFVGEKITTHRTWGGDLVEVCTGDKRCPVDAHRLYPCACCDWTDSQVVKVRSAKKTRLNAFLKTGKLPASWMATEYPWGRTPWPKSERFDAHAVVLPNFPKPNILVHRPEDLILKDVFRKYLEAKGEKPMLRTDEGEPWSCGCLLRGSEGSQHLGEACEKHKRALVTGAEED